MLISQPISRCLTNHSELCMSRLVNNQPRRISIYRLQRRPSFGFQSSVSSTPMTSGDPVDGNAESRDAEGVDWVGAVPAVVKVRRNVGERRSCAPYNCWRAFPGLTQPLVVYTSTLRAVSYTHLTLPTILRV